MISPNQSKIDSSKTVSFNLCIRKWEEKSNSLIVLITHQHTTKCYVRWIITQKVVI